MVKVGGGVSDASLCIGCLYFLSAIQGSESELGFLPHILNGAWWALWCFNIFNARGVRWT